MCVNQLRVLSIHTTAYQCIELVKMDGTRAQRLSSTKNDQREFRNSKRTNSTRHTILGGLSLPASRRLHKQQTRQNANGGERQQQNGVDHVLGDGDAGFSRHRRDLRALHLQAVCCAQMCVRRRSSA